jgi:hypothetical protein
MNPNDLLILTIPAAMAALKFGLIASAVVMLARGVWQPQIRLSPQPIAPSHAPQGSRGNRA